QVLTVRAKKSRAKRRGARLGDFAAGRRLPHARSFFAQRGELFAVGPESYLEAVAQERAQVAAQGLPALPARGVPLHEGAVRGHGGQELAARMERRAGDHAIVTGQSVHQLSGGNLPEPRGAGLARRDQVAVVGTECQREDGTRVAPQLAAVARLVVGQRRGVPEAQRAIDTGGDQAPAVAAESQGRYHLGVTAQGQYLLSSRPIPDLHDFVPPGGDQTRPVRAESGTGGVTIDAQGQFLLAGL